MENWPLHERLDALTIAVNTLSGLLVVLECGSEPRSATQLHKRVARRGFGTDPDTFDAISYGALQNKIIHLAETFTLIDSYEQTRPPSKGRGGRVEPTVVRVFEKDPRGYWFGDPLAARVLATCAELQLTPAEVFTSAEQKGETRAPATTARILYALARTESVSELDLVEACFWTPDDRNQYRKLRARIDKNIKRLVAIGLLEKETFQETVLRHTGRDLDTYPRRDDGTRRISETDRLISYLDGRGEVKRQSIIEDVQTHHLQPILNHLYDEGVVERVEGGMDDRSQITLTDAGSTVRKRVVEPLFQAIAPDIVFDAVTRTEYKQIWHSAPTVDDSYLTEAYRDPLRAYCDDSNKYRKDVMKTNLIDRGQNPWR